MLAIAFSTFKEIYRKRIFHIITILTILYLILLSYIVSSVGKEVVKGSNLMNMIFDVSSIVSILGFYFSSMLVAFLTVMLSIGMVSGEIESGTILTILTKPIRRFEYVLGKYIGTAILVIIYSSILYLAVIIISTMSNISFVHTFGIIALIKGFLLFILQPLTILAVALLGSICLKTLNNGILVISLYLLGNIGGVMEQIGNMFNRPNLATIGILSSLISPFDSIYRKMVSTIFSSLGSFSILGGFGISNKSSEPSVWMIVYAVIYLLLFVFVGIRKFQKKDIAA